MGKKRKYTRVASDMIFSIAAVVILNAVIQLFIYPSFNRKLGPEAYGEAITVMSMVAVMGIGFGIAANYSRMVMSTKKRDVKGDYNIFLLMIWALCVPVAFFTAKVFVSEFSVLNALFIALLMISTVTRYYSDAEFKLNINYKGYFVYNICIAAGYSLGMPIFFKTGNWMIPMIIGEIAAVVYTAIRGSLYHRPLLKKSEYFREDFKSFSVLSCSYVADTLIQNADRLLLNAMFSDGTMVTTFYNAALIGKVIALLTTSLNTVLIGYLSKFDGKFTKKFYNFITVGLFAIGVVAALACTVVSHIFIRLMYPDTYEACKPYFFIANAGQVLYFISSTIMIVVLRFADEKYQMQMNVLYTVLYLVVVPVCTYFFQIWGLAFGILAVNFIKFLIVYLIGLWQLGKKNRLEPQDNGNGEDFDAFVRPGSEG